MLDPNKTFWHARQAWQEGIITRHEYVNLALENCEPNPFAFKEWCDSMPPRIRACFIEQVKGYAELNPKDNPEWFVFISGATGPNYKSSKMVRPESWVDRAKGMLGIE